jgi:HflC protein
MTRYLAGTFIVLLILWGRSAFYSVDQAEYVYVTRFGQPITIHNGATAAGLHIKAPWPVESVERIDRRVQSFDLPSVESLDASVTWKIPDPAAADRFFRTVRTPEQARKVLGPLINGRLAAIISALEMDKLISVIDVQTAMAGITGFPAVAAHAPKFMAEDVKLIDARTELVRRRRFSYPEAVRSSIAERIRSERAKKVADYESEGRQKAAEISAEADRVARTREADARAQKTVIEGQASADAARIRAAAYSQDRDFYLFLENLRAFQTIISETRDVLLLSTKHPLMKPLAGPPEPVKK